MGLTLAGDASEFAGGAYQVSQRLRDGGLSHPIVVSMPPHVMQWGSTRRELWLIWQSLLVAVEKLGAAALRGKSVLSLGDNQGACSVIEKMFAKDPNVHALVVLIWEVALTHGFMVRTQWMRWDTPFMMLADAFSKLADHIAWSLARNVVNTLFAWCRQVVGQEPTLDASADHMNHKCTAFIARELCPG